MKIFNRGEKPSWGVSLIPFVALVAVLVLVIKGFGADALSGGSQVALMFAAGVTVAIGMVFYRIPWKDFENAMVDNISSVATSVIILLLIGAVAGSWMISGVVPTLIYYGMKVITPAIFLFATCVISAVIAVMTGSSWTTIATIGVALVGIGTAQGFDPGWTAGAIISGAYFGDKVSPLSDTTVLASSSSGTPLFTHIRFMMITTVPSFLISVVIFLVASLLHETPDLAMTADFAQDLKDTFNISPWLLLAPVLTGLLIARKVPAIITLFAASVIAGVFALIFQPHILAEVALACGFQKIHKPVSLLSHGADAVRARQGGDMHQNTAFTHGHVLLYSEMERMLSRHCTWKGTVSCRAQVPFSMVDSRISTLRSAMARKS